MSGRFPESGTQAAKAAYWGEECRRAIQQAVAYPRPVTIWDHDLDHAVRTAKMAAYHALQARPDLKEPRGY